MKKAIRCGTLVILGSLRTVVIFICLVAGKEFDSQQTFITTSCSLPVCCFLRAICPFSQPTKHDGFQKSGVLSLRHQRWIGILVRLSNQILLFLWLSHYLNYELKIRRINQLNKCFKVYFKEFFNYYWSCYIYWP